MGRSKLSGILLASEIENRVSYHPPTPEKIKKHELVRELVKDAMTKLSENLPQGREASVALTKLEEVMYWANAAIARN